MATFEITEGAPGQGKSLYTAMISERLLKRNIKWYQKMYKDWLERYDLYKATKTPEIFNEWLENNPEPQPRKLLSNMKFSEEFELAYEGLIEYWSDTQEICKLHDCDIIWDEIATELDSRNFANLTVELKRFLSQYRKRGVDIYANTQDFSMIDARARLMVTHVRTLTKVIGSRDISTTKPNPKYIWGIVLIRDINNFRETNPEKKKYAMLPSFFLIEKRLIKIYDTRQDIPMGKPAPLRHIELCCEFSDVPGHKCNGFKKVIHQ